MNEYDKGFLEGAEAQEVANRKHIIEPLQAELAEKQELIDQLCSQEPCPKCGYGVTGACYGCEIKQLQAEVSRLKEALEKIDTESGDVNISNWPAPQQICQSIAQQALKKGK